MSQKVKNYKHHTIYWNGDTETYECYKDGELICDNCKTMKDAEKCAEEHSAKKVGESTMNNMFIEDKLSGPYFSMTYNDTLQDITLTVYNVEEEDKEKAIKDAFDFLKAKYGKDVSFSNNRITFDAGVPDDERFEIIELLTDYKPFQTEELTESVINEDTVGSIAWNDLNATEQDVANRAFDIIQNDKEDVETAVRIACDETTDDNCSFDRVLSYVQSSRTITELCKEECTNPGSVPSIPGKHKRPTKDETDRLELDEDYEVWDEYGDPVDLDRDWANAYGGDREYCDKCGKPLYRDEFGSYCPNCDGLELDITHGMTDNNVDDVMDYGRYYGFHELDENTNYRVIPCEWGFELPKTIKTKIKDTLKKYLGNTEEMRDTYRNIIDDRLINIYGNYDSDMDYELNALLKPYVKALATESLQLREDAWEDGPCGSAWGNAGMNMWYDEETGEYYSNDYLDNLSSRDLRDRDGFSWGDIIDDWEDEDLELDVALEAKDNSNEFGDASDINLSGDVEKDFETVVNFLRNQDYSELGDALNDIVNDPKLYALLSEGFGDGELANVKMSSGTTTIAAAQLLPSQSEIGLDNSLAYPLKSDCHTYFNDPVTIVAPIITYRKTFIIDGHHRWSQALMINPKVKMTAINFNYEEESPYRALRNFQGAIAVANKDVPSQVSKVNNVYEMSESEIRKYVEDNIQDVCVESLIDVGVAKDKEGVIDYIVNNAMLLKANNPPFANAPDREYMPQTDDKSIDVAEKGQTNI